MVQQGHAIECRINAEDLKAGFRPCPGTTKFLHFPGGPGVRVDSLLYNGYSVSPYYDSLVAKVIVHAPTRLEAIRRMRRALEEMIIDGYPTTADFCHLILYHPDFVKGQSDTGFLAAHMDDCWTGTRRSNMQPLFRSRRDRLDRLRRQREEAVEAAARRSAIPENGTQTCPGCGAECANQELVKTEYVCPHCGYHLPIGAYLRLSLLLDPFSFRELGPSCLRPQRAGLPRL